MLGNTAPRRAAFLVGAAFWLFSPVTAQASRPAVFRYIDNGRTIAASRADLISKERQASDSGWHAYPVADAFVMTGNLLPPLPRGAVRRDSWTPKGHEQWRPEDEPSDISITTSSWRAMYESTGYTGDGGSFWARLRINGRMAYLIGLQNPGRHWWYVTRIIPRGGLATFTYVQNGRRVTETGKKLADDEDRVAQVGRSPWRQDFYRVHRRTPGRFLSRIVLRMGRLYVPARLVWQIADLDAALARKKVHCDEHVRRPSKGLSRLPQKVDDGDENADASYKCEYLVHILRDWHCS